MATDATKGPVKKSTGTRKIKYRKDGSVRKTKTKIGGKVTKTKYDKKGKIKKQGTRYKKSARTTQRTSATVRENKN